MAYNNAAAETRPDIKVFLEQAREADKGLIAERVLGVYQSDTVSGKYPRYMLAKGNLLKVKTDTKRGPGGSYKRVNRAYEWDSFDCEDRGLEGSIDDTDAKKVKQFFDMEVKEALLVRRNVALAYEIRVANLVMNSGLSGFTATNPAVNYTAVNLDTINFPQDVADARLRMEAVGVDPNEASLVMSSLLWNRVRRTKILLSYVFGNNANVGNASITLEQAAKALEIKEIIIGGRNYDNAKEGAAAANMVPIWPNSTFLLAKLGEGDFANGGIGRTITWTEDASGLYVPETYREEVTRSDIVRVRQNTTEKIIDVNEGQLVTTNYS